MPSILTPFLYRPHLFFTPQSPPHPHPNMPPMQLSQVILHNYYPFSHTSCFEKSLRLLLSCSCFVLCFPLFFVFFYLHPLFRVPPVCMDLVTIKETRVRHRNVNDLQPKLQVRGAVNANFLFVLVLLEKDSQSDHQRQRYGYFLLAASRQIQLYQRQH